MAEGMPCACPRLGRRCAGCMRRGACDGRPPEPLGLVRGDLWVDRRTREVHALDGALRWHLIGTIIGGDLP